MYATKMARLKLVGNISRLKKVESSPRGEAGCDCGGGAITRFQITSASDTIIL